MMFFDPVYFLFLAPAMILAAIAQMKVKSAYHHAAAIPVRSGLTGAQAARQILDDNGLHDVEIELHQGTMTDHYDPRHKVLRLSPHVYKGRSVASLGIAAHEAGHALQDGTGYAPLALRNGIVPMASMGGSLGMILLIAGMFLQMTGLVWLGIIFFSATVVFQLVNLPVEFDASARAKRILFEEGMVDAGERDEVRRVLSAAALTYVAATLTAILTLLYFLYRSGLLSGDRR